MLSSLSTAGLPGSFRSINLFDVSKQTETCSLLKDRDGNKAIKHNVSDSRLLRTLNIKNVHYNFTLKKRQFSALNVSIILTWKVITYIYSLDNTWLQFRGTWLEYFRLMLLYITAPLRSHLREKHCSLSSMMFICQLWLLAALKMSIWHSDEQQALTLKTHEAADEMSLVTSYRTQCIIWSHFRCIGFIISRTKQGVFLSNLSHGLISGSVQLMIITCKTNLTAVTLCTFNSAGLLPVMEYFYFAVLLPHLQ